MRINLKDTWEVRDRWEWETYGEMIVFGLGDRAQSHMHAVIRYVDDFFAELGYQVKARFADRQSQNLLRELFEKSTKQDEILCLPADDAIFQARSSRSLPSAGLIVGIDGQRLRLNDQNSSKPDEPPEWGWTSLDGLVVLRLVEKQPLENVVRHELGHLFGLEHHLNCMPNCLMNWNCCEREFCESCCKSIRETVDS